MISLYNGQPADLLGPNYRRDPEVKALSYAIQQGMQLLLRYAPRGMVYADLDNLQEPALDLLAVETDVQSYDKAYDVSIKRELVKNAIRWHQIAGTRAAVEELARKIFGDCEVQEWYEYDGQPYRFRVVTSATASADDVSEFNRLVSKVQNLRSHLESVSIVREISSPGNRDISIRVQVASMPPISCVFP